MAFVPLPGAVLPWIEQRFFDANGDPLAGGKLYFYIAGSTTPKEVYPDATLTVGQEQTQPIVLNADGRPDPAIFIAPGGYDIIVTDADDVQQYTIEGVEDVGLTFASNLGLALATGHTDVVHNYDIVSTDQLVTVDGTGGTDPCVVNLPAAIDRQAPAGNGLPLVIKNVGAVDVELTPYGSDTIDGFDVLTIPAATATVLPSVVVISDGAAAWYVMASHGLTGA